MTGLNVTPSAVTRTWFSDSTCVDGSRRKQVEAHRVDADALGVDVLTRTQVLHEVERAAAFDDERAVVGEVRGDVLEAADLIVLGQQVEERVEHDIDQAVGARHSDIGEVADRDVDLIASRLRPKLRDHRLREVDAVDADAGRRERQRDPAGADRELERGAPSASVGKERDGRLLVAALREAVVDSRRWIRRTSSAGRSPSRP